MICLIWGMTALHCKNHFAFVVMAEYSTVRFLKWKIVGQGHRQPQRRPRGVSRQPRGEHNGVSYGNRFRFLDVECGAGTLPQGLAPQGVRECQTSTRRDF